MTSRHESSDISTPPVTQVDANEREEDTRRFGLHPMVIALVVLYFILYLGVVIRLDREAVAEGLLGMVLPKVLIIGLPSWFMWRMGRSRLAGNITCAVIVCILLGFLVNNILAIKAYEENQHVAGEFSKQTTEMLDEHSELMNRANTGEDVSADANALFDQNLQRMEKLGSESSGQQADLVKMMAELMRGVQEPTERYNDSYSILINVGDVDPSTMSSTKALADRLLLVENYSEATELYSSEYAKLEPKLTAWLQTQGFGFDEIVKLVGYWRKGAMPGLMERSFQADREIISGYRGIIALLTDHYGAWSVTGEDILFEDESASQNYTDLLIDIDEAYIRQDEIFQQYNIRLKKIRRHDE